MNRIFQHKYMLFCLCMYCFIIPSNAQQSALDKKISLDINEMPLHKILQVISIKGGVHFSYAREQLPMDQKYSLHTQQESIRSILDRLFGQAGIRYQLIEKQIILKRSSKEEKVKKTKKFTLGGSVQDTESGELLIGATVAVEGKPVGTITNPYGFYSLTLKEGTYTINYSFLGHETKSVAVRLDQNKTISIGLQQKESQLQEVVVVADDKEEIPDQLQLSKMNVKPYTVKQMPYFMGEGDLIKSLQSLPGITSYGDGSTSFFVRGGYRDQNIVLLDEAPIYNPSHFMGFFSSFVPAAIKDIKIYKGGLPAQYGGRLSSVIDIRTKDGNYRNLSGTGSIGLVTSRFAIEGPIAKDKVSFFISGRRSHIKNTLKRSVPGISKFGFYDLNGKVNIVFGPNDRVFISGYGGKDEYFNTPDHSAYGITWENGSFTTRWNHIFNEKLFSNTTFTTSHYKYNFVFSSVDNRFWESVISNTMLKSNFTWYINPDNTFRFGVKFAGHKFNPGNLVGFNPEHIALIRVPHRNANEQAYYISNEQTIHKNWSLHYGLRLNVWRNTGPTYEFSFDREHQVTNMYQYEDGEHYHTYAGLAPRFSSSYKIFSHDAIKIGYARTYQYIHLLSNSTSPFTSMEVWMPSGPNIKPQKADQVSAGYVKSIPARDISITTELFYKWMQNQIGYAPHANMTLNPLIESELRFGHARSYGIEWQIQKKSGRLRGWINYTLSKTMKKINDINNNDPYPPFYDRPHQFSIYAHFVSSPRWKFTTNWLYHTGTAYTEPAGFYYYNDYPIPLYAEKNNARFPDYHRLDISVVLNINPYSEKNFKHDLTFTLFNAYGRKNPVFINFNKIQTGVDKFVIPSNLYGTNDIVPSQIYLFGVIPSLKYSFHF